MEVCEHIEVTTLHIVHLTAHAPDPPLAAAIQLFGSVTLRKQHPKLSMPTDSLQIPPASLTLEQWSNNRNQKGNKYCAKSSKIVRNPPPRHTLNRNSTAFRKFGVSERIPAGQSRVGV